MKSRHIALVLAALVFGAIFIPPEIGWLDLLNAATGGVLLASSFWMYIMEQKDDLIEETHAMNKRLIELLNRKRN